MHALCIDLSALIHLDTFCQYALECFLFNWLVLDLTGNLANPFPWFRLWTSYRSRELKKYWICMNTLMYLTNKKRNYLQIDRYHSHSKNKKNTK